MIIKFINKIFFLIKFLLNPQFFFKESRSQNENQENIFLNYLGDFISKKTFIEIGFHHLEFNCINLIKKNFKGLMIDGGRPINIYILKFIIFILRKDITILKRYLTIDNVLESIKFEDIGCLSVDIDGNDYHIREALDTYMPRVIVMEYNGCFGPTSEYVMGYNENYSLNIGDIKFGASLLSLINQANRLGYDYVYSESRGADAFFIRKDINPFKTLTSEEGWVELFWYKNKHKDIYKNRNL